MGKVRRRGKGKKRKCVVGIGKHDREFVKGIRVVNDETKELGRGREGAEGKEGKKRGRIKDH